MINLILIFKILIFIFLILIFFKYFYYEKIYLFFCKKVIVIILCKFCLYDIFEFKYILKNFFFFFYIKKIIIIKLFYLINNILTFFILNFIKIFIYFNFYTISLIVPLLICVAYLTLVERKIIGASQRRLGPELVGLFGIGQPIADGVKLFLKETILPSKSNKVIFIITPMILFFSSLLCWLIIPLNYGVVLADVELGVLFFLAISSLNVYSIILAGWSSNSKYALLGALRSAAQMISYEVSIGIILISIVLPVKSLNLSNIVYFQESIWLIFPQIGLFILFFISALAETNRAPFDLPEAESELVSGYNVEYSAMGFALFFLAEYSNIILICVLMTLIFLGGWLNFYGNVSSCFFILKILLLLILFIWIRTTLPRYRFDQLMLLGWKVFLPLSLGYICLEIIIMYFFF